jgi:hypothetical protein
MQVTREVIITLSKRRNGQPPVKYRMHQSGAVTTTGRNPEPLGRVLTGLLLTYGAISEAEYEATEKMYKRWHPEDTTEWVHNPSEVPAWG